MASGEHDKESVGDYRRALRSAGIAGGATIAVAVIGIVRSKALALLVGPAGLGLMGVFNSFMVTAVSLACLGVTFSGVREIATASGNSRDRVRRWIWIICLSGALLFGGGTILLWSWRPDLLPSMSTMPNAGWWLAAGIFLTIVSGVQMTVLQGLRRIGALSRVRVGGAMLGVILAIAAVWYFGRSALAFAVISVPLGNVVAGLFAKAPSETAERTSTVRSDRHVRLLLSIGFVSMLSGFASTAWQFLVRNEIVLASGVVQAGLYQAAYSLSAMNVSLVLTALAADYFPRLSEKIDDSGATQIAFRQQFDATIVLGAPMILAMIGLAPVALYILFSPQFFAAWPVLQWQALGDLLRLPGWVISMLLIARTDRRKYLGIEITFAIAVTTFGILLTRSIGVQGAGIAYAIGYAAYSALGIRLLPREVTFGREQILRFVRLIGLASLTILLSHFNLILGVVTGTAFSAYLGWGSLSHVRHHLFPKGRES